MVEQAIQFSEAGETVVFGIFKDAINVKSEPLIVFDLELKFQKYPNVIVKLIPFDMFEENNLEEYKNTKIFFGDEFPERFRDDINKNETISFLNSLDFCWLTVSNLMSYNDDATKMNLREYVESWKPDTYNIIELKTPIRSTKEIAQHLKENLTDRYSEYDLVTSKVNIFFHKQHIVHSSHNCKPYGRFFME